MTLPNTNSSKAKIAMSPAQIVAYTLQKLETECYQIDLPITARAINKAVQEIGWEAADNFRRTGIMP